MRNKNMKSNKSKHTMSNLNKALAVAGAALGLDGVIAPFFTGGTIHEHLGLPPASDYRIWGERTALMAEQALFGALTMYQVIKERYSNRGLKLQSVRDSYRGKNEIHYDK